MLARPLYEGIITETLYGCQTYLEIGSFDGGGIVMLSKRFPDKKFYSIDPFIEDGHTSRGTGVKIGSPITGIRNSFMQNISGCENITHFDMTDIDFMAQGLYNTISPDILFIDGNHDFKYVCLDLHLAELFAKNKRLFVVMDDIVNITGVAQALKEFKEIHPEITFNNLVDYGAVYFYIG